MTLNSLSYFRNHYKYTIVDPKSVWIQICFANSPWIHYLVCKTTINSLWSHYETTLKSLWKHYMLREFTLNPLFLSWYQYECTIFFAISQGFHHVFREFTIGFSNFLWIHYLLRNFSLNPVSFLRIHYLFREFILKSTIVFSKPLWICYWNHYETTRKSIWIHYFVNLLSVSRLVYENTICFTILLWIYCLFRKLALKSLSIAWFHYEFTIYFAISEILIKIYNCVGSA